MYNHTNKYTYIYIYHRVYLNCTPSAPVPTVCPAFVPKSGVRLEAAGDRWSSGFTYPS